MFAVGQGFISGSRSVHEVLKETHATVLLHNSVYNLFIIPNHRSMNIFHTHCTVVANIYIFVSIYICFNSNSIYSIKYIYISTYYLYFYFTFTFRAFAFIQSNCRK